MPLDRFEGKIPSKTRDQVLAEWLDSHKLWHPAAETGPKSFPFVLGSNFADSLMPIYAMAEYLGDATSPFHSRGAALDDELKQAGLGGRKPATGAIGWAVVATGVGGSEVVQGDRAKYKPTGKKYEAKISSAVVNGQPIVMQAVDAGPETDLPAGAELEWMSPRPGMSKTLVVFENPDGSGITGGTNVESDEEGQQRLADRRRNPAAAGNQNEVVQFLEDEVTGIAIQKGFVVPGVLGPGTKSVFFTMRPAVPGGTRVPSSAVIAVVEALLKDKFPGDDGIFTGTFTEEVIDVQLGTTWKKGAAGFADASPWPAIASTAVAVGAAPAPTALTARLTTTVDTTTPAVNQSIGFYDSSQRVFVRKLISAVAVVVANRSWDLTFSSSSPLSDTAFTPAAGQVASPWSDSLDDVVPPLLTYFDRQGPGELYGSFADPGVRQRRVPEPAPEAWPSRIENRMVDGLFNVVADAEIVSPSVPLESTVGTPPLLASLHKIGDIAVFKQT
jgi:hypothetical protein